MPDFLRKAIEYEMALAGPEIYLGVAEPRQVLKGEAPGSDQMVSHDDDPAPAHATSSPSPANEPVIDHNAENVLSRIPIDSPVRDLVSLEALEQYVRDTILIPLDATRTNPVFGVGNPEADLMIVGEAPGADEDAQGEPFVGRAGQLLNQILKAIGFEREEIYIANILKSRPPNNRNPLPEEIAAHEPVLYRQISLIKPKIILTVGLVSAGTLLQTKASLTSLRQHAHDFHGIPLYATYHPAALLRNPNWKRPTWEDVQLLRAHYDRLIAEHTN